MYYLNIYDNTTGKAWQEVFEEAKFQSVIPMAYDATSGIEGIPTEVLKQFKSNTIAIMFNNDKVVKAQSEICKLLEDNKIKLDENGCIALSDNAQDILCNAMLQALTTALGDDLNDLAKLYNEAKTKSDKYSESITKADEVIEYERQQVVRLQTIIDNMKIATNNQASVNRSTSEQLAKHVNLVKKYEKENKQLAEENEKLKKTNQKLKKELQDLKGKIKTLHGIVGSPMVDLYLINVKK